MKTVFDTNLKSTSLQNAGKGGTQTDEQQHGHCDLWTQPPQYWLNANEYGSADKTCNFPCTANKFL